MADLQVVNRLFTKAAQLTNSIKVKCINARDIFQQTKLIKFTHVGFAKAFNIHCIFTNKMDHSLHHLRRAFYINTAPGSFAFFFKQFAVAHRAIIRKNNFFFAAISYFCQWFYYIWNYIACTFHQNSIANSQIFFFNYIFIKQRNGANSYTAYKHRVNFSNRCNRTCSAHLKLYIL